MKQHVRKLHEIAYARSGDKGANANIGVIAYDVEGYNYLVNVLTEDVVKDFFKQLNIREVKRYLLPNLNALNFVLIGILSGDKGATLRIDAQGKALGQAILELELEEY